MSDQLANKRGVFVFPGSGARSALFFRSGGFDIIFDLKVASLPSRLNI
jgi:hypothetical protein